MAETNESFIGVGKIHARAYGTTGAFRHVGNASQWNFKVDLDVQEQRDYTRLGGGILKRFERIKNVKLETTWLSFITANLAVAMAADVVAVGAGVHADEVVKGYKGSFVRLAAPPDTVDTVTNAGGTTTYAAGTDYEKSPGGLWIPEGSTIAEAADLKVTYDSVAHERIEAGRKTASELELVYECENESENGKPLVVEAWRVRVPSADEIALIGEKFGELKFQAEVMKDPTKGSGVSAYYRALKG